MFSGFLSVDVHAAEFIQPTFIVEIHNYENNPAPISYGSGSALLKTSTGTKPYLDFDILVPPNLLNSPEDYITFNFINHTQVTSGSLLFKITMYDRFGEKLGNSISSTRTILTDNYFYYTFSTNNASFNASDVTDLARINVQFTWPEGFSRFETSSMTIGGKVLGADGTTNDIIAAIQNQTSDLQQSIEDQYSGDPETEFSVDDVITQHNEKMGVLSFGSDVMLQFLDMFQSANVGAAQLTLPGFNITVENVEYSVWPDYSFNFEQLNEWVPGLMSVIRMMLPAFVWLMVLRYCINVFEKNFLSNGG